MSEDSPVVIERESIVPTGHQLIINEKGVSTQNGEFLMCTRSGGEFAGKALMLTGQFEWQIVEDTAGFYILVATRRK